MNFSKEIKILIVDDDIDTIEYIKSSLTSHGLTNLHFTQSAVDALVLLDQSIIANDPFKVILSDWNMPGQMSGKDFLETVRRNPHFYNVPFIMITANNEVEHVNSAILEGVSDYIVKPITNTKIIFSKIGNAVKKLS